MKYQASIAENEGDLLVAEQLWIRVLAVSRADRDAIRAIQRIAQRQVQPVNSISETLSITQPVASPGGDRGVVSESTSVRKDERPVFEFEVVTVNAQGHDIKREQRQAEYITEDLGNGVSLEMVSIPGGKFLMGSPPDEAQRYDDESLHEVTVAPFFIGKYPITQTQWRAVAALKQINRELKPDPSNFKGDNLPVEQISWYEAVEFCDRLSKQTNRYYRLPSEAEWEYACRSGTTTPFHFGETIISDLANYSAENTYGDAPKGKSVNQTTQVGKFKVANAFGLCDLHGNVWEWCYAPTDGSAWIDIDRRENNNQFRMLRGGSWHYNPRYCRSASRSRDIPGNRFYDIGFRVVTEILCYSS